MSTNQLNRVAAMIRLVDAAKPTIGRTALMKLCFFAQVIRGVPLGYEFSLYSYGPFDSDVMADLQCAEGLSALKSSIAMYPGGYGYLISAGEARGQVEKYSAEFLMKFNDDLEWTAHQFGGYSASDLELMSTVVFVSIKEPNIENVKI